MANRVKKKSWVKTFGYAWEGLLWAIHQERNFKIHSLVALVVIGFGCIYRVSLLEWAVLFFAIFFVLVAELFNTALERLADLASGGKYHPLAKVAKDLGASAVMLAAINAIIMGIIIFGSRI